MNNFLLGTIVFGIILVALIITYIWYAIIITKKNRVKQSLSGIDVQLQKRNDLIPNILKIAAKFMEHERNLIEKVTALRTKISEGYNQNDAKNIQSYLENVGALDNHLGKLMIAVENYPNLKSDQTMIRAQLTYSEIEEHIAAARRFYNSSVAELNNAIEIFPGNFIALLTGAKPMPFYEASEDSKLSIDANKFL